MTPTPPVETQPSMSAKIAASVERDQQVELQMLKEKIDVQRLSDIVAEGRPARGKSRLKAHRGQMADRKDRSVARRKAASRSRARNRK